MDRKRPGVRAVVDTNVVAYYLLGTLPFVEEVRRFWRLIGDLIAPAIWEAELANLVWVAIRSGVVPAADGPGWLRAANRLGIRSVPSRMLWQGALDRSIESGVAVYDTLFIELAARRRLPLATFDTRVLTAFPQIARRPGSIVAA
jgi:predicted nucleic acid-binding protein